MTFTSETGREAALKMSAEKRLEIVRMGGKAMSKKRAEKLAETSRASAAAGLITGRPSMGCNCDRDPHWSYCRVYRAAKKARNRARRKLDTPPVVKPERVWPDPPAHGKWKVPKVGIDIPPWAPPTDADLLRFGIYARRPDAPSLREKKRLHRERERERREMETILANTS